MAVNATSRDQIASLVTNTATEVLRMANRWKEIGDYVKKYDLAALQAMGFAEADANVIGSFATALQDLNLVVNNQPRQAADSIIWLVNVLRNASTV